MQQGSPSTIPEALHSTAERGQGEYVFHLDDGPVRLSCPELAERAERGARRLAALGVGPGDPVGVLGPNRPEWVVSAFAIWTAGAVVVPMQLPVRIRDPRAFEEQQRAVLASAGSERVLSDPRLASLLPTGVAAPWDEEGGSSAEDPPPPGSEDPAVIQFTSGSTATPRGALIPHSAAMAQMEILDGLVSGPTGPRSSVHWVPFFHDMGLFLTVLTPAIWGATCHYLPTERFARDPAEWLRLVEAHRAHSILGPSTAFGSALRAVERRDERPDLSSLELVRLVAEAVDPGVAARLTEAAPRFGLKPETLGSGYGLAEAVLAVTLTVPGEGLQVDRISLDALAAENVALDAAEGRTRTIASSGPSLKLDLRIAGPNGEPLEERQVGEILLHGASLMSRYIGAKAPDPFSEDGWLATGDMGYVANGELYVTGRATDMVIVMGHNYYPEDFEWAAGRVEGVRPGRCVAFTRQGTEEVIVLVESNGEIEAHTLEKKVRNAVSDAVGVSPAEVLALEPGAVQKTTSGKLRRAAMRDLHA
ncbi:MAG TPA: AMP-binding protein [Solirubrobacterales bacterium]|nr:AMP-binding protein [Solirubrobacterales bacterium]